MVWQAYVTKVRRPQIAPAITLEYKDAEATYEDLMLQTYLRRQNYENSIRL